MTIINIITTRTEELRGIPYIHFVPSSVDTLWQTKIYFFHFYAFILYLYLKKCHIVHRFLLTCRFYLIVFYIVHSTTCNVWWESAMNITSAVQWAWQNVLHYYLNTCSIWVKSFISYNSKCKGSFTTALNDESLNVV